MNARHSDSLMLVWRVAAAEARHLRAPKIEPHHLFLGLCKVVDLNISGVLSENIPDRDAVLEELLREVRRVRNVFRRSAVDPKILRRKLRRVYGKDSLDIIEEGPMRRSESAKKVFSIAEGFGGVTQFVVFPVHLLYAVLSVDDVKRDAAMAGLGIDKKSLTQKAKEEVFVQEHIEVTREALRRIGLN